VAKKLTSVLFKKLLVPNINPVHIGLQFYHHYYIQGKPAEHVMKEYAVESGVVLSSG
jgi:hypothetical protein